MSLIRDDNPEVDGLFRSELFVVPLLLDTNSAVCLNRHPWIIVTNLKCLTFGLLLQLENVSTFGVTIRLGELNSFRWADCTGDASLLTRVLGRGFVRWFLINVFQVDDDSLIVRV